MRKDHIRRSAVAAFVALGLSMPLAGLELGVEFDIGNLGFADDRAATATDYPLVFPWGISFYGSQAVNESVGVDIGFYTDPTLNFVSYSLLTYNQDFFTIRVGPFFGFFNTKGSLLKPGISTAVRADIPGLVFALFRADSTIGGRLVQEGDYLQERSDVAVGFYVPNAICSVELLTKSYTYRTSAHEIVDSFAEYAFKTDLHQKNTPYRIALTFGYQQRKKTYVDVSTRATTAHTLNSVVIGTALDVELSDAFSIVADLDSSVFSFGDVGGTLLTLPSSGIQQYLFHVTCGFRLDIDALRPPEVY